jgi:S1-C subfamily serine protease
MNRLRILSTVSFVLAFVLIAAVASANMAPPENFVLGLSFAPSADGPRVTGFQKGSPAERAGLKIGDLVLGADGRYTKTMSAAELKAYFEGPRYHADLIVVHDGKAIDLVRVYR